MFIFSNLKCTLYNLICLNISHYFEQFGVIAQKLSNNLPPLQSIPIIQTLLNHIGSILTLTLSLNPPPNMVEYLNFMMRIPMFKYMLYSLIPLLVFSEPFQLRQYSLNDRFDQAMVALLQHALDNPTPVGVLCEYEAVPLERFNNMVHHGFLLAHGLDDLLDDVVAVLVLDQLADAVFQFGGHQSSLFGFGYFDCFLHYSATLHVFGVFVDVAD